MNLFGLFIFGLAVGTTDPALSESETITFTLTVETEAGDPVPQAPMRLFSASDVKFGLTDDNGELVVEMLAPAEATELRADLDAGMFLWDGAEQKDLAIDRFTALRNQYSFEQTVYLPLTGDGPAYSGTVIAYDSVTVSGRLVDPLGMPVETGIAAPPHISSAFCDEEGRFQLGGVRKGTPVTLIVAGRYAQGHLYPVSAEQLAGDTDVGDIVVSDDERDATGVINVTDRSAEVVARDGTRIVNVVSLISEDGARLQGFSVSASGTAFYEYNNQKSTSLPLVSGTWYVTMGGVGRIPWQMLLDALRDGRGAELEAAGVPKLVIQPGDDIDVTISALDAWNALKSVVPEPGP
jgi:hypothetical protein